MKGEMRKTFLENEGRQKAGTGHYRDADVAFHSLVTFLPFAAFEFDAQKDFADFRRGFQEVQDLRELVMLTKAKAQADNSFILKELEGKGMTFLVNRIHEK